MSQPSNLCIALCATGIVVVGYYLYNSLRKKEDYSIALGMIAPQNYFYAKCTNDCVRDKTGDSSTGQFKWLCTDNCEKVARARMEQGIPDLTREEYQRYYMNGANDANGADYTRMKTAYKPLITIPGMVPAHNPGYVPKNTHTDGSYWSSEFLEGSYCMNDVANWCAEKYCPFSNHPWCMKDCIKMRGVDCGGAVIAGDQF